VVSLLIISQTKTTVMKSSILTNNAGSNIYPGLYQSGFDKQQTSPAMPARTWNVLDLNDMYLIEVPVSGTAREDLCVEICDHTLFIEMHDPRQETSGRYINKPVTQRQSMSLPADADESFVRAEWKNGSLHIYFQKTAEPIIMPEIQVAVY
jgi:HSP20 family molecular chaperone IbpA